MATWEAKGYILSNTALTSWKYFDKTNVPSHSKPFPMYVGLQEQLYEPCVLIQEAFWWHSLISVLPLSLHSSISEKEQVYFTLQPKIEQITVSARMKRLNITKFSTRYLHNINVSYMKRKFYQSQIGHQREYEAIINRSAIHWDNASRP